MGVREAEYTNIHQNSFIVLLLLEKVPESSNSRPRSRYDLGQPTDVNIGSLPDLTVGNQFVEPGFYLCAPTMGWILLSAWEKYSYLVRERGIRTAVEH